MYVRTRIGLGGLKQAAHVIAARISFNCNIFPMSMAEREDEAKKTNLDIEDEPMIRFANMDNELFMYATEIDGKEMLRIYSWGCPDGLDRYNDPKKLKFISHGEIPIGPNGEGIDDAIRHALRVLFDMSVSTDQVNQRLKKLAEDWPLTNSLTN